MKWPPGREGAWRAPVPKLLLTSPQDKSARAITQACDPVPLICSAQQNGCAHKLTVTRYAPCGIHFAKEVCLQCGAFIRWLPRPQTLERQRLNAFRLAKLAMCDRLSTWERGFVASVAKQKKLSPKQLAVLERLVRRYLGGGAP
jgi:hypothetical protein